MNERPYQGKTNKQTKTSKKLKKKEQIYYIHNNLKQ